MMAATRQSCPSPRGVSDVKHVLKEDAGLALNFNKTKILVKGISAAYAHAAAQRMLNADPSLAHLSPLCTAVGCALSAPSAAKKKSYNRDNPGRARSGRAG
jgi:hypothetical protein